MISGSAVLSEDNSLTDLLVELGSTHLGCTNTANRVHRKPRRSLSLTNNKKNAHLKNLSEKTVVETLPLVQIFPRHSSKHTVSYQETPQLEDELSIEEFSSQNNTPPIPEKPGKQDLNQNCFSDIETAQFEEEFNIEEYSTQNITSIPENKEKQNLNKHLLSDIETAQFEEEFNIEEFSTQKDLPPTPVKQKKTDLRKRLANVIILFLPKIASQVLTFK